MTRPYLVLVDGKLFDRKLTRHGAGKVVQLLKERGLKAVVAYELENGKYELTTMK